MSDNAKIGWCFDCSILLSRSLYEQGAHPTIVQRSSTCVMFVCFPTGSIDFTLSRLLKCQIHTEFLEIYDSWDVSWSQCASWPRRFIQLYNPLTLCFGRSICHSTVLKDSPVLLTCTNQPLAQGLTSHIAQQDQTLLEDLNKAGFRTNLGPYNLGIGGAVCLLVSKFTPEIESSD